MDLYHLVKSLHIIGACVLLGTGAGIAYFMVMADRTKNPALIAHTASVVVTADFLFTTTAVILQPLTGAWLASEAGYPLTSGWIAWSLGLYVLTGAFWLPVVGIQIKLRALARAARDQEHPLPHAYHRLYRIWFACGFPAFAAVLGIIWLMITKPTAIF